MVGTILRLFMMKKTRWRLSRGGIALGGNPRNPPLGQGGYKCVKNINIKFLYFLYWFIINSIN